ncbi:MAG: RNA-binding protein Jag [uncultured Solirubrobacterales bacterium]|uniref:RNA-binding protein Jag n=1 Tax=uncultured Solirubrobacterales bacterium TaxID=768556 RepID=A0A6J4SER8_9ACTN|nr:MAG: RNA-binding protein Jag [uncultured Solirubrobacterales bacterium]
MTAAEEPPGRNFSRREDPAARAGAVVEAVVAALEVGGEVRVTETEEEIRVSVEEEDDAALLIGKHGATIDALQHLAARAAFQGVDRGRKRVVIDAGGYRERRQGALERAADQAVEEALSFGRSVELDPMNSFERRIVHNHLKDRTDVDTHSEGDEPERRLVVSPLHSAG